jgi:hypothetical protein
MRLLSILVCLFVFSSVFSLTITPFYIQVKETGNESLPSQNVSFKINCDTKTLLINSNSAYGIPNPKAYLFNTNYGYSLFGTSQGQNGKVNLSASGNVNFLTALFILRVDSPGYRSKEIEFTFQKCFDGSPDESVVSPDPPLSPPSIPQEPSVVESPPTPSVPEPSVLQDPVVINSSSPSNNSSNVSAPSPSSSSGVCAMPFGLISFFLFFLHANRRRFSWKN